MTKPTPSTDRSVELTELADVRRRLTGLHDPAAVLEGLFTYAPVGLQIYDKTGKSVVVNRAFRRIFGSAPPPSYSIFNDEIADRAGMLDAVRRAFAGATVEFGPLWYDPREIEHVAVTDGRRSAVKVVAFPLNDGTGALQYVAMVVTDVTAEFAAAEKLRQTESAYREELELRERRFRALIDHSSDGIALVDPSGFVRYQSPAVTHLLGYSVEEEIGRDALKQVHPDDIPALLEALRELPSRPNGSVRTQYRVRHRNGEWRWVESVATNLLDEPAIGAFVFNYRDITDSKAAADAERRLSEELERRVLERTAQLEAANAELESFSYSISHDLRAPLRSIAGFTRILLLDHAAQLSDEARAYLQRVDDGTRQMSRLIDDLLAFSRLGRQALRRQPIDMTALAQQVVAERSTESDGQRVTATIAELPACDGDPALLRQVVVNIVDNAFKYSRHRENPVVEIGSRIDDGTPVYFVRDNGIGFEMQFASNLFGVFQRLHLSDDYEGVGVGLAIAQRILQRHGGRIWAEAEHDRGATFYWTVGGEE